MAVWTCLTLTASEGAVSASFTVVHLVSRKSHSTLVSSGIHSVYGIDSISAMSPQLWPALEVVMLLLVRDLFVGSCVPSKLAVETCVST